MEHKLARVRSARKVGHPHDPCRAECVCGWLTDDLVGLTHVGAAFDVHLLENNVDPLTQRTPWREPLQYNV